MAAEFKKKTVSKRRDDETKSHRLQSVQEIQGRTSPLHIDSNCAVEKNWWKRYKTPNLEEADLVREEMF